jgi:erythromycin esterase-like protein
VRPTLDYVRSTLATDRPIETCGFDHQFSGGEQGQWPVATIAFLDKSGPNLLTADLRESLSSGFAHLFQRDATKIEATLSHWQRLGPLMDEHRAALITAHGEAEFAFMRRCADDAVVSAKSMLEFLASQNAGDRKVTDNNTRDKRMAENLAWLLTDRYKDRKVIAWMATMHAVHDIQEIHFLGGPDIYKDVINCGSAARGTIGDMTYTIGFTAADGQAGNVWAPTGRPIAPPTKGSLEDLCVQTGKPFLLIDFKGLPADHWLRQPLVSRPLGYGEMTAVWPDQMDAMLYTKTMFPSTRQNALPPYAVLRAGE